MKWLLMSFMCLASLGSTVAQLTMEEREVFVGNSVTISDDADEPDDYWTFSHTGLPDHEYGDFNDNDNPNEVSQQDHKFKIPKNPEILDTPECLKLGSIAVAISGIPIFNPYTGTGYNAVDGDNAESFDDCDGHPQNMGAYHYHQLPSCLYQGGNDQLMGVALDGFPIYGPLSNDVNLTSAELDDCHGQMRDGKYEYRMTYDFPYVLGCFMGDSTSSNGVTSTRKKRQMPGGGMGPPGGGDGGGMLSMDTCLYVKFCENPTDGCPEAATLWGGSTDEPDDQGDDNEDGTSSGRVMTSPMTSLLLCISLFGCWGVLVVNKT